MGRKRDSDWEDKNYSFFQHRICEYFPCHQIGDESEFNCLFCYCPLYALGDECGGNFRYSASGAKDCSPCVLPHRRGGYGMILEKLDRVAALAARPAGKPGE